MSPLQHQTISGIVFLLTVGLSSREGVALRVPSFAALRTSVGQAGEAAQFSSNRGPRRDRLSTTALDQSDVLTDRRRDFADGDDLSIRNHWALLVAGSAGWSNYRHQADVCHAYQVLLRGGLRPAHMVVMMYDDIAYDTQNPFPGKVFNSPGGPDVYTGVRVDYRGDDVSAATFLAVLEGDASAVPPGNGTGRVLASGPYDRIFIFYSDHGSPGVLGMPSGNFLYADQLVGALQRKYERGGYKEAVLYIEACESGSMFEALLPANISAYATTASSSLESSWGTYCPGMDPGPSPLFSTCLGDLYSVAWMENAERCDLREETLLTQYDLVRNRTSRNYTYVMGSHVMQYGSLVITREVAGDYQGMRNRGSKWGGGDEGECRTGRGPRPSVSSTYSARSIPLARGESGGGGEAAARGASPLPRGTDSGNFAATAAVGGSGRATAETATATQNVEVLERRGSKGRMGEEEGVGIMQRVQEGVVVQRRRQQLQEAVEGVGLSRAAAHAETRRQTESLEQRDADLAPLRHRRMYALTREDREEAEGALERELNRRRVIDSAALTAASSLLNGHPELALKVAAAAAAALDTVRLATTTAAAAATAATSANTRNDGGADSNLYGGSNAAASDAVMVAMLARELTHGPMGRPAAGRPLVDDWDCLRAMVAAWTDVCGPMDQYAMRHTRLLANLCNADMEPGQLGRALRESSAPCGARGPGGGGGYGGGGIDKIVPAS